MQVWLAIGIIAAIYRTFIERDLLCMISDLRYAYDVIRSKKKPEPEWRGHSKFVGRAASMLDGAIAALIIVAGPLYWFAAVGHLFSASTGATRYMRYQETSA